MTFVADLGSLDPEGFARLEALMAAGWRVSYPSIQSIHPDVHDAEATLTTPDGATTYFGQASAKEPARAHVGAARDAMYAAGELARPAFGSFRYMNTPLRRRRLWALYERGWAAEETGYMTSTPGVGGKMFDLVKGEHHFQVDLSPEPRKVDDALYQAEVVEGLVQPEPRATA